MEKSRTRFCELYRPIGALLLLLAILLLLLRTCSQQAPSATVPVAPALPTVAIQATAPVVPPVAVQATLPSLALPKLNVPLAGDFTVDGVKLSGTGQPGEMIDVWDGATKVGAVKVGADGTWSLVGKLAEGAHKLAVRTVDTAGKTLNESAAVDVTVPAVATGLAAVGQAYIVKQGDWLTTLAQTFYGDWKLYTLIIEGTNAKAAVDPSFTKITNPDLIEPGQKLWIPAKP